MIDSIEIENIQSHKDTKIEFCSGVNAIVGSSNNGKTAILRSLCWARYNRPLGIDTLCSHWALDDKGNQKQEMSVKIIKDGQELIRRKTKSKNQYIVNGKELSAVKTDVPVEVEEFFRLSETNIQSQQDSPFLISASSSDVGKYFNKIVRLDIIDKVLSNSESKRRKVKQEKQVSDDLVKKYSEQLEEYNWLDKVEKLIVKYENIKSKLDNILEKKDELELSLISCKELISKKNKYDELSSFKSHVRKLESLDDKLDDVLSEITDGKTVIFSYSEKQNSIARFEKYILLKNKVSEYEESCDKYDGLAFQEKSLKRDFDYVSNTFIYNFEKEKKLISQLDKLNSNDIKKKIDDYYETIYEYERYESKVKDNEKVIEENKAELPDICPLCGHAMED